VTGGSRLRRARRRCLASGRGRPSCMAAPALFAAAHGAPLASLRPGLSASGPLQPVPPGAAPASGPHLAPSKRGLRQPVQKPGDGPAAPRLAAQVCPGLVHGGELGGVFLLTCGAAADRPVGASAAARRGRGRRGWPGRRAQLAACCQHRAALHCRRVATRRLLLSACVGRRQAVRACTRARHRRRAVLVALARAAVRVASRQRAPARQLRV
jgi:hypothetical protein